METKSNHFNQEIQTEASKHKVLAKEFKYDVAEMFPSTEVIAREKEDFQREHPYSYTEFPPDDCRKRLVDHWMETIKSASVNRNVCNSTEAIQHAMDIFHASLLENEDYETNDESFRELWADFVQIIACMGYHY